jgi:Protein of unknown function (DUF3465)
MLNAKKGANLVVLAVLLAVAYFGSAHGWFQPGPQGNVQPVGRDSFQPTPRDEDRREGNSGDHPGSFNGSAREADEILSTAFERHQRNVEVEGVGRVVRVLPDDDEGIEHQKFILRLGSGQELLVAHNTDLAERIPALKNGDTVEFRGEYEWNPQGGVVHWTHRDPQGRHADGWLKRSGQIYQ